MLRRWIVPVLVASAAACGQPSGDPATSAEWLLEIPEGVPVFEPEPVPRERRTRAVEPILDLAIGAGGDEEREQPPFFAIGDVAVDDAGRMYVLDQGTQEIKVLSAEGEPLATIGGRGEGPGELSQASHTVAVAGTAVMASDGISGRFTFWEPDGTLRDTMIPAAGESVAARTEEIVGLADGSFVVVYETPTMAGGQRLRFLRLDPSGAVLATYPDIPVEYTRALFGGRRGLLPVVRGRGWMAVSASDVFLSPGEEYQVLALDLDGAPRWALRSAWPRAPFPEGEVDRAFASILGPLRSMGIEAEADHGSVENLPDRLPALSSIKVDGRGRLWVFPYEYWDRSRSEAPGTDRPVDVYDRDGNRLFTGVMPAAFTLSPAFGTPWIVARGDHVYGVATDPDTLERSLVRHRLELPAGR